MFLISFRWCRLRLLFLDVSWPKNVEYFGKKLSVINAAEELDNQEIDSGFENNNNVIIPQSITKCRRDFGQ